MRAIGTILGFTLLAAACAGNDPTVVPSSTVAVDLASVTPAVGITTSAAERFDEAGLTGDGRSRFVPLNDPEMVTAADVTWLDGSSIVMGVVHESGETQAYPVDQMAYHHIANTTIAGEPFLVTY